MINEFRGKYYFLSNFYKAPVTWGGITYTNNEGTIVGEYHATASFVYDTNNYNDVSSKSAILKITKRHISLG